MKVAADSLYWCTQTYVVTLYLSEGGTEVGGAHQSKQMRGMAVIVRKQC